VTADKRNRPITVFLFMRIVLRG